MPLLTSTNKLNDANDTGGDPCTDIINKDDKKDEVTTLPVKEPTTEPDTINCQWIKNKVKENWVPWAIAAGFGILWVTKGNN